MARMISGTSLDSPEPAGVNARSVLGVGLAGPSRTIRVEPIGSLGEGYGCLEAPDLIDPVTAFHSWRLIDGQLCSAHQPVFSHDPVLERFEFGGGVYGYFKPDRDFPKVDHRAVTGILALWGEIEVCDTGMRAEHARIEALAPYSRSCARLKRAVRSIAADLGVDLIDLDEIETAASDYGSPLPASLLGA
jgi:hypothetical protein